MAGGDHYEPGKQWEVPTPDPNIALRDWFAGMALQGMCSITGIDFGGPDGAAKVSYLMADAMMKARDGA